MNTTYESATTFEKAVGKAHQFAARSFMKSPFTLPESFRGVSFCFDDFPQSAADYGAKALEDAGAHGIFYTCFGLLGTISYGGALASLDHVTSLAQRGHEIGCHTYDHINCSFESAKKVALSCSDNINAAKAQQLTLMHFSYPQGGMSVSAKKFMRSHYLTARSGFQGINQNECDAHCLKSFPLYESNAQHIHQLLDDVERGGGWLILYTHDVADAPSEHGVAKNTLKGLVSECASRRLPIRSFSEMTQYMAAA